MYTRTVLYRRGEAAGCATQRSVQPEAAGSSAAGAIHHDQANWHKMLAHAGMLHVRASVYQARQVTSNLQVPSHRSPAGSFSDHHIMGCDWPGAANMYTALGAL